MSVKYNAPASNSLQYLADLLNCLTIASSSNKSKIDKLSRFKTSCAVLIHIKTNPHSFNPKSNRMGKPEDDHTDSILFWNEAGKTSNHSLRVCKTLNSRNDTKTEQMVIIRTKRSEILITFGGFINDLSAMLNTMIGRQFQHQNDRKN